MVTGDYLFDPQNGQKFDKNDDHLAQIIELLGNFPRHLALSGKYSSEFFNRKGELRRIHKLKYWDLENVLIKKYGFEFSEAKELAEFLMPMLNLNPKRRITALEALKSPFLVLKK